MTDLDTLTARVAEPLFCLFSGGKDSFATAAYLQEQGLLRACVLLDTGISVPEWKAGCVYLCEKHGFDYEIIPTPIRYEWLVYRYGFPGPGMHGLFMNYLKGRCIREFKRKYPGAALASGVREQESSRRKFHVRPVSTFEGVTVHAPIFDWSTDRVMAYVQDKGYGRPLSYVTLGISGDCLCGAFAREHEREAIEAHYPDVNRRLCELEKLHGQRWGQRAVDKLLDELDPNQLPICWDCERLTL